MNFQYSNKKGAWISGWINNSDKKKEISSNLSTDRPTDENSGDEKLVSRIYMGNVEVRRTLLVSLPHMNVVFHYEIFTAVAIQHIEFRCLEWENEKVVKVRKKERERKSVNGRVDERTKKIVKKGIYFCILDNYHAFEHAFLQCSFSDFNKIYLLFFVTISFVSSYITESSGKYFMCDSWKTSHNDCKYPAKNICNTEKLPRKHKSKPTNSTTFSCVKAKNNCCF